MLISDCFTRYLNFLQATSSNGNYQFAKSNIKVVNKFFISLALHDTDLITIEVIFLLIEHLKQSNNITNSINKKIGCLKRALKHNQIIIPGVSDFPKISYKRQSFKIIQSNELLKLFTYFNQLSKTPQNLTKILLFWLFLYTGARLSELLNVRITDLDLENNCIYLSHTKSGIPRNVFYSSILNDDLRLYISYFERDYLFWNFKNNKNCPLNADNVENIFQHVKEKLNLNRFTPHMLRHTMATLLLESDAPLNTIKELLGHSSLVTTEIYLHLSIKKLKADYEKYFPVLAHHD